MADPGVDASTMRAGLEMATDGGDEGEGRRDGAALPKDIQEHLGRRLRTALHVEADKPAYLGESNIPPQFQPLVRKLEASERGERQGYDAVKRALIGDEPVSRPARRGGREPT